MIRKHDQLQFLIINSKKKKLIKNHFYFVSYCERKKKHFILCLTLTMT